MQTSIFKDIAIANIEKLVDALKDGRKGKEVFKLIAIEWFNSVYLLEAKNNEDRVFNAVDYQGLTPKNFVVNWRTFRQVFEDIEESQKIKQKFRNTNL